MKKQSRSEARRAAFTQVFQMKQHMDELEAILGYMLEELPQCNDNLGYITSVVNGVKEHEEEIDALADALSRGINTLVRIRR